MVTRTMPRYSRRQWLVLSAAAAAAPLLAACAARTPRQAPGALPLVGLQMLSATEGWAYGAARVYRTADGGRSWTDVSPAVQPTQGALAVAFSDARTAWAAAATAAGVTALFSGDGGRQWASAALPGSAGLLPRLLSAGDARHGFLWASRGASASEPGTVYATADAGGHWASVATAGGSLPVQGLKNGLTFRDATHGWLAGAEPAKGSTWLYASTDGGRTWARQDLPLDTASAAATLATGAPVFFGAVQGVLPLFVQQASGFQALQAYTSHDGGGNWSGTSPVSSPKGSLAPAFADGSHWFASDGANMYSTGDAGQSWTAFLTRPTGALVGVTQLCFISPTTGWALRPAGLGPAGKVTTALQQTTDGGRSWQAVG